ncbi:tripartite motif-containing protein 35-like [Anguilla anguilla]|uniref:tripartite motif-containing protein 35-like n=1 Tax=Anguilla anguilla TaxID=7936 RepID=UPI0015AFD63F|nr:tripartite motif-containing protein 35-like [Anguilla anguilla]
MSDTHCSLHGEKLLIFCEHDKESLCLVCQTSKYHRNHPVCSVEEAALDLKSQAQHTERQIKAEFEKLHHFLREEEEARLAALRDEEEQKSEIMKEKIENITAHICTLTDKITIIEKAMDTGDASFVKVEACFTAIKR